MILALGQVIGLVNFTQLLYELLKSRRGSTLIWGKLRPNDPRQHRIIPGINFHNYR